jgi:hypothetical protein
MRTKTLCTLFLVTPFAFAFAAKPQCDLPEWRELSHEASVLKAHPTFAQRNGKQLRVLLENGKSVDFEDKQESEEPGGPYEHHRVISVSPKGDWVTIFEPGSESFGYRVVHRKSGKVEELGGCPIWSKDGKYFVAIHEDLESGRSQNEASMWLCQNPADFCDKIWFSPHGGRSVKWNGSKVEIVLSKIDQDQKGQPEVVQTVRCSPQKAKANCQASKSWKVAKKPG